MRQVKFTVKEAIEKLQAEEPTQIIYLDAWYPEDITYRAERHFDIPSLTTDEIIKIFKTIQHGHDADLGINWNTIDAAIIEQGDKDG